VSFQILRQNLCFGAHNAAHCGLNFADGVCVTVGVAIDDFKLNLLLLFEEIRHRDHVLEVGVELIPNLFSLSTQDPLVVHLLMDNALRV
jgi:hypothetical protein